MGELMNSNNISTSMHCLDKFHSLQGETVKVFLNGQYYRQGIVDDVMHDGSGFWLAAEGCVPANLSIRQAVMRSIPVSRVNKALTSSVRPTRGSAWSQHKPRGSVDLPYRQDFLRSGRWIRKRIASSTARCWTVSSRTKPRAGTRPDRS
jgi:hypothetical protein